MYENHTLRLKEVHIRPYLTPVLIGPLPAKWSQSLDLETKKEQLKKMLSTSDVKLRQIGYPDCIYYAKDNRYVVYSWWNAIEKEVENEIEYPIMFSHDFNDEGIIMAENIYYSSNHRENNEANLSNVLE